ncbi:MAG: TM2 domain-containing protein [Fimbriimonadaceae bacterium]|nr:TM2 domain-containing protein [Fimbriimonadaceae bacterium]
MIEGPNGSKRGFAHRRLDPNGNPSRDPRVWPSRLARSRPKEGLPGPTKNTPDVRVFEMFYVIGPDGARYGPADTATLRRWCSEGRVRHATLLEDPLTQSRFGAGTLPELADLLASVPPPVPPPTAISTTFVPPQAPSGGQQIHIHNYVTPAQPANLLAATPGRRNRWVAALLAFFLGGFGAHRFYLGHIGSGIAMVCLVVLTCGYGAVMTGIWAIIDLVLILTGSLRDVNGNPLEG